MRGIQEDSKVDKRGERLEERWERRRWNERKKEFVVKGVSWWEGKGEEEKRHPKAAWVKAFNDKMTSRGMRYKYISSNCDVQSTIAPRLNSVASSAIVSKAVSSFIIQPLFNQMSLTEI